MEEVAKVGEEGFLHTPGAPWLVRLIPRDEDVPCAIPGARAHYPHQYDLIFTGHHAVANGVGAGMLVFSMMDLINDVMNGVAMEEEEVGHVLEKDEIWDLEASVKQRLEEDPQRYEYVKQSIPSSSSTPLFLQAFPRPEDAPAASRHVVRSADPHVTANLQKKCKIHGVTLNSVISASINIAVMRLLKGAGMSRQSYRIVSSHAVNIARYLKRTPPVAIGGYGLLFSFASDVDADAQGSFWEYCKRVNQAMKESLRSGLPLEQKMLRRMMRPDASPEEEYKNMPPVVHDFGVTNVGSFPAVEPDPDDRIIITDAASYNVLHNFVHMNLFQVLTFRGRLVFSLSYATDYIANDTATSLADEVLLVLQEVSDFSSL